MLLESLLIGVIGAIIGSFIGLVTAWYLQQIGIDFSSMLGKSSVMISNVMRADITPFCFLIGFIPGLLAPLLGTLMAGIGIFQRQTSELFKELEV